MEQLALVMAAGEGARMLSELPKPLHRICGVPMVEHVLRALDAAAQEKALIVARDRAPIEQALGGRAMFIEQDRAAGRGTGYALMSARAFLKGRTGQVIVTACDKPLVLPETYARLVEEVRRGAACAMLTGMAQNPFGYSRIIRAGGRVCASLRQGALTGEQFMIKEVDASVYCFDVELLLEALSLITADAQGEYHLSDVVALLHGQGHFITSVPALEPCECMGVNDRMQLAEAERAMRLRINARHMRSGVTLIDPEHTYIQPDVSIAPDVVIHPGCTLERGTSIDRGCVIAFSRITNAHIGAQARIDRSVVSETSVAPGTKVGPFEVITGRRAAAKV